MNGFEELYRATGYLTHDPMPLALRVILSGLFVIAGTQKLRHPLLAATAALNFRVVAHVRRRVGVTLGAVEVVTGLLLVLPLRPVAVLGASCALALALGFALVIGRALVAKEHFSCHCLSSGSEELSALSFLRAVMMAVAAAVALATLPHGEVVPSGVHILDGIGLAAAIAGIPTAGIATARSWRRYRGYLAGVDWEWVLGPGGNLATGEMLHR